jgi:hypothetical protein
MPPLLLLLLLLLLLREQKGGCAQAAPASAKLGRAPRHEGSAGGEDLKLRKRRRAESLRHSSNY